jgi:hypothetical protein
LIGLLAAFTAGAQVPVGITRFIDPQIYSYPAPLNITSITGDNEMATPWASNAMLPLFPDPAGIPVLFPLNDGNIGACGNGGIAGWVQISKLAGIGVAPTTGNTALTAGPCIPGYATAVSPNGTWNDGQSWKGAVAAFRSNRLLAYVYRQSNAGDSFTDSSLVMSPDAGQTWVDYGRYSAYAVTGATCSSSVVVLTVSNSLSVGQKIYVHDMTPDYGGKQTITALDSGSVTYTLKDIFGTTRTCPSGVWSSGGSFGILASDGSAPDGPLGAYNMMWPASAGRQMVNPAFISYGQDGNYLSGIESVCAPNVYVCGTSLDLAGSGSTQAMYLWRVPVSQEMTKASYQWYTCPGYVPNWPVADSVCDGSNVANWTSTMSSATPLLYATTGSARPQQVFHLKYLPSHKAYVTAAISRLGGRLAFYWAPHPWGPYYPVTASECTEGDVNNPHGCAAFFSLLDYGENIVSTTPPVTQIRSVGKSGYGIGGSPVFWTVEAASGRVPFTGAARRADFMGISGQLNMGHRFTSGVESDAISRRGAGYSLDWWSDIWDHGGMTTDNNVARTRFRDLLSGGTKHVDSVGSGTGYPPFTPIVYPLLDGVHVTGNSYAYHLQTSFTDSAVFSGNSSWTAVYAIKADNISGQVFAQLSHSFPVYSPWDLEFVFGGANAGDVCVSFSVNAGKFCTAGSTVTAGVWYFLAVSAKASASGYPTLTYYLGNAGSITEFGGTDLSVSATGSSGGGITKTCTSCTLTQSIATGGAWWYGSTGQGNGGFSGTYGELGLYSGVVPSYAIREIYRTLRTDWARVGRGAI